MSVHLFLPDVAWTLLAMLAGASFGSFAGLVSLRLPAGAPIVAGRSACPGCGRTLGVVDLLPVASFLLLAGRCRTCRAPIPRRYVGLELAGSLLGLWASLAHPGPQALAGVLLAGQLLLLALLDAEHFWLPRKVTLPLIGTGLLVTALGGLPTLAQAAIGATVGYLCLAGLAYVYRKLRGREGLGGGDAYLLAGAGAWVGWMGLPSVLLLASLAGLSLALVCRLLGRPIKSDQPLPFGVFLALGTWITWLHGPIGLTAG